jgi:hypothetical protein
VLSIGMISINGLKIGTTKLRTSPDKACQNASDPAKGRVKSKFS